MAVAKAQARHSWLSGGADPLRTEAIKACVVLAEGTAASDTLKAEIQDHVRRRLAAHEYPRIVEFVDALPMTATGKIMRRVLREAFAVDGRSVAAFRVCMALISLGDLARRWDDTEAFQTDLGVVPPGDTPHRAPVPWCRCPPHLPFRQSCRQLPASADY